MTPAPCPRNATRSPAAAGALPHLPPPLPRPDERDAELAALVAHLSAFAVGVQAQELGRMTRCSAAAARARQVAMYLAHTALSWPLSRVAAAFGRDRTTVSHACGRVEDWRDDAGFDARLGELEACLQAMPQPRALASGRGA